MAIVKINDFVGKSKVVTPATATPTNLDRHFQDSEIYLNDQLGNEPQSNIYTNATNKAGTYLGEQIKDAFTSGVDTVKSGYNEAKNAENPLQLLEGGTKLAAGAIGTALSPLAAPLSPITEAIKFISDKISNNPGIQDFAKSKAGEITQRIIEDISNLNTIAGAVSGGEGGAKAAPTLLNDAKTAVGDIKSTVADVASIPSDLAGTVQKAISPIKDAVVPESAGIMNKVARLKPMDAVKFQELSGKTPGEYLTETGNFGAPDTIIKNEASKFSRSINEVDSALEKLPGTFEDGAVTDALQGLKERAKATSGDNVKSPYLSRVDELAKKHETQGLTMKEINEVKRLYEKNVKLGYNKLVNGDKVEQATNIDNSLRNWQVKKAEELGFKNISELNKQTQISKLLVNKLGEQIVGQNGLNGINLTDWVVLAGGDPTSVAGFLTKKFFSSKSVQAKIAEFLNRGNEIKGDVKADLGPSQVKQLPAGDNSLPNQGAVYSPIKMGSATSIEPAAKISRAVDSVPDTKLLPAGNPNSVNGPTIQLPGMKESEPVVRITTTNPKTGDMYVRNAKTGEVVQIIKKK